MAKWRYEDERNKAKMGWVKFARIHCFTCGRDVSSKSQLSSGHLGHDVHYVDKYGNIDE